MGPKTPPEERGKGRSVARAHGRSWSEIDGATLSAACDINAQNLEDYAAEFAIGETYRDYREMFATADLDIVDICTWPGLHCEMVTAAAEAGIGAIYCEKPMCLNMEEADRMVAACRRHGVTFSIGHQRRLASGITTAKRWIDDGLIGKIVEMTGRVPADLMSWGTHWLDLYSYFLSDVPAVSVFAQADCSNASVRYGHYVEDMSLVAVKYAAGVYGYILGDFSKSLPENDLRIIGENGIIEIRNDLARMLCSEEKGWTTFRDEDPSAAIRYAFEDLIAAYNDGREPALNIGLAYAITGTIMAAYESAATRAEVFLPVGARDYPLERLVKSAGDGEE